MSTFAHTTVLLEPTVDFIAPRSGGIYVDCTLGGGGHTALMLERSAPDGRVIGIDRDPIALLAARERLAHFGDRFTAVHSDFGAIKNVLASQSIERVHGACFDLMRSPEDDHAWDYFRQTAEANLPPLREYMADLLQLSRSGEIEKRVERIEPSQVAREIVAQVSANPKFADIEFHVAARRQVDRVLNAGFTGQIRLQRAAAAQ